MGKITDKLISINSIYPEDILKKVSDIVKKIKPEYSWKITLDTNLILDCFFDSLDMAELKSSIQSTYPNSSNPPLLDLKTVGDIAMMALWKSATNEELKPCNWIVSNDSKIVYELVEKVVCRVLVEIVKQFVER